MSCCSSNGGGSKKSTITRRVPLKMLRSLTLIRSADEKLLTRVLGKFDIGVFFGKSKDDSFIDNDLLLEVVI